MSDTVLTNAQLLEMAHEAILQADAKTVEDYEYINAHTGAAIAASMLVLARNSEPTTAISSVQDWMDITLKSFGDVADGEYEIRKKVNL